MRTNLSTISKIVNVIIYIELVYRSPLHCPTFNDYRHALLRALNNVDCKILESTYSSLAQTLVWQYIP